MRDHVRTRCKNCMTDMLIRGRCPAEIGEHLLRAEGRFGVDHPLDPTQFAEAAGEGGGFRDKA
jgi:hypothetical protein